MAHTQPLTKERIELKAQPIENGCWLWKGAKTLRGYGQIISNKKTHYAHRASYEAFIGPIPTGMVVCHACDNPECVNPAHLFLGTQKQNLQDMKEKGRSTLGEKNSRSKLTEMDVKIIKSLFHDGFTCTAIAKSMNVSVSCISSIKRKERWTHV